MSFIKILIITFGITLFVMWWKHSLIARVRNESRQQDNIRQRKYMPKEQEMVRCSYCEVYVPVQEAIKSRDCYYCSKEHYQKGH